MQKRIRFYGKIGLILLICTPISTLQEKPAYAAGKIDIPEKAGRITGTPVPCDYETAARGQKVIEGFFKLVEVTNGCLGDLNSVVSDNTPGGFEAACTLAMSRVNQWAATVRGSGAMSSGAIAAIKTANQKIKAKILNDSTVSKRSSGMRLEELKNVTALSPEQQKIIAKGGRLDVLLGKIFLARIFSWLSQNKTVVAASISSTAILELAPDTSIASYEEALCNDKRIPVAVSTEGSDGCVLNSKMTEDLADSIINGTNFDKVYEQNPLICTILNDMAATAFEIMMRTFPELEGYSDMALSHHPVNCYSGLYNVNFTNDSGKTQLYQVTRSEAALSITADPPTSAFATVHVPLANGIVRPEISLTDESGKILKFNANQSGKLSINQEQVVSAVTTINFTDKHFFGPFVNICCDLSRQGLKSPDTCPPLGYQVEQPLAEKNPDPIDP